MNVTVEPLTDVASELGEGPVWSEQDRSLYWIDMLNRAVRRHDVAARQTTSVPVSGLISALSLRRDGGLLAGFRNGIATIDPASGVEQKIDIPMDFARERFNDGKCDRRGRFFIGSMDKTLADPIGGLYRLDADRGFTRVADDVVLSNGLAWSPDDRLLYHCDSRPGRVYKYDYDIATGDVANRRLHIDFSQSEANPDGCTIDAEGCLWIAEVGAWEIGRYDPEGKRIGGIRLPVRRVTSATFGGDDLATLYITTMRYNQTPEQLREQPLAGCVFVAHPGVRGLPEASYAG